VGTTEQWAGPMRLASHASALSGAKRYAGNDRNAHIHRAWLRRGLPGDASQGLPHIAVANTASDLTAANAHLAEISASVWNGIYEAGGLPLELPEVFLGETQVGPTDGTSLAESSGGSPTRLNCAPAGVMRQRTTSRTPIERPTEATHR